MTDKEKAKSKFVYPDKLYVRCKDNKTLDMSYAPQNMEAVEYIRTDAFIEKAEEFIYSALNDGIMGTANIEDFMRLFKNYMEGE